MLCLGFYALYCVEGEVTMFHVSLFMRLAIAYFCLCLLMVSYTFCLLSFARFVLFSALTYSCDAYILYLLLPSCNLQISKQ
jgi:hypothetical protein